ncbi:MAG: glycine cleavage system aminomethyltransferase GcvT [Gammaproteobacteria bacterium]|nr:glycine cleavage system aminomethyltransferase GcvT [Gammaproteobacteria bacterium]MBU1655556.1 glycine cleavage system aminomethyltransferase GcvT [Gammaproteobacteria bacterium]MBU1960253.1 glycine cleavage system aminomethyltransferase GcvT [Gammaproteobacteria bacterium]
MTRQTTLNTTHREMGARMVPFGGWDMPLHYGSQIEEHHAVRRDAGMFDVSHMSAVDVVGQGARPYLRHLLANDVDKLHGLGRALYSCMLTENGGVIDDLIVYRLADDFYRLVVNAGTTEKDLAWLQRQLPGFEAEIRPRTDLDMIAIQGPKARAKALPLLPADCAAAAGLAPFNAILGKDWMVARTGYTGEDGFEVMLPKEKTVSFWRALHGVGILPCGLGARDTLRLEAGMNLYGSDMNEQISPLEAGLGWTLAWEPADRDFIGRYPLQKQKSRGHLRRFVGLLLEGKGVLRNHQKLFQGDREIGEITSGGFSPTLERSIALARIASDVTGPIQVDMRGKCLPVRLVKTSFVRHGRSLIEL